MKDPVDIKTKCYLQIIRTIIKNDCPHCKIPFHISMLQKPQNALTHTHKHTHTHTHTQTHTHSHTQTHTHTQKPTLTHD